MSGPKSYSYSVRAAALAEARERQSLRDSLARIATERATLAAEIEEARRVYKDDVSAIDSGSSAVDRQLSLESLRSKVQTDGDGLARQRSRFRSELASAARAVLVAGVDLEVDAEVVSAERALESHRAATANRGPDQRDREIARLVAKLAPDEHTDTSSIHRAVTTAQAAEGARADLALDALRVAVSNANRLVAERERAGEVVRELLARLDGFSDELVASTRARILAAARLGVIGEDLRDLERLAEETIGAAYKQEERRYVADELASSLEQLGYVVSDGFQTALVSEGFVDVRRSDWDGYAVRVRAPQTQRSIGFNVVRGPAWRVDQEAQDIDVERAWCNDVSQIETQLQAVGVAIAQTAHALPGAVRMQEVTMPTPAVTTAPRRHTRKDTT